MTDFKLVMPDTIDFGKLELKAGPNVALSADRLGDFGGVLGGTLGGIAGLLGGGPIGAAMGAGLGAWGGAISIETIAADYLQHQYEAKLLNFADFSGFTL